jgi:hypothetical protein
MDEFWAFTGDSFQLAKLMTDENIRSVEHADLATLQAVLIQYRWFTSYYPGDLAILVSKLPPSSLRSLFGRFLDEELGEGDPAKTHPALYDRFLEGLGIRSVDLEEGMNPANLGLLDAFRYKLLTNSYMYGVGLRGMGAECLCQVYLEALHRYLMKNPEIQKRKQDIDWSFWDIHAGPQDQEHASLTRQYIGRLATAENIPELALGFLEAERMFKVFWENAYNTPKQKDRVGFGRRADSAGEFDANVPIPTDGWRFDPRR